MFILVFVAILKRQTQKNTEKVENDKHLKKAVISLKTLQRIHKGSKSKKYKNLSLLKTKYNNTKKDRIEENMKFISLEKEIHRGSQSQTTLCLKNCLYPSIYKTIHEDNNPGFVRKHLSCLETFSEKLEEGSLKWLRWLVIRARRISQVYVDLFKDGFLAVSIFWLIGGFPSMILFPTKMTSVVVVCLFSSIFIAMLLSSVVLAIEMIN